MNIGTETCYKCRSNDHITRNCMVQVHRFFKFMELAPELRERIYEYALSTDHPISPHLCDSSVKFHDDSQRAHNAIDQLLGITKVSKQIRAESLPMFYSANAFNVGKDTTSYFDRLEHLGRFHMVRHVRFEIYMEKQDNAAVRLLRRMNQYIKEEDRYIKTLLWPVGASNAMLTRHPQYTNGGLPDLNTLITLRKLTSVFPNSATYSSKLVIPVPNAERVTSHDRLKWFPVVMYGLGISLHYVENVPFDYNENGRVGMTWHQKYQKKDFTESGGVAKYVDGQTEVYKRALELCPQLESQPRAKGSCYPRSNCRGMYKGWCDIPTEGGWVEELKID
ncbi:hypothetical protein EJ02DRAFT_343642 [Clathrospora elynae]|uniref:Uncharacterized protein n=1 Tax=Clathrospora elynae TaxID=706981 RepID=A0A6A5T2A5_9PLEO|nr:hypothetical protein EJ02DRAFT_343642 [Clathrospora elynae]